MSYIPEQHGERHAPPPPVIFILSEWGFTNETESLPSVGKPEERGLSWAELQVCQVHAAVQRQDAAVGANDDDSALRQHRVVQLEHCHLLCPVERSDVTRALIPDPQVRQWGGGVKEEQEVSKQQRPLFTTKLAQTAEETATGQALSPLLLYKERR